MFKKNGIEPLAQHVYLSSPTMHGEEFQYMKEAYDTNWMSTVGANINEVEKCASEKIGCKHAVALSSGTAALQISMNGSVWPARGWTWGAGRKKSVLFRYDICRNGQSGGV